ncbi:hypothetical protein [Methanocella conradii]|nr:hypothetical protein [Methanocella conradii]
MVRYLYDEAYLVLEVSILAGCGCGTSAKPKEAEKAKKAAPKKK